MHVLYNNQEHKTHETRGERKCSTSFFLFLTLPYFYGLHYCSSTTQMSNQRHFTVHSLAKPKKWSCDDVISERTRSTKAKERKNKDSSVSVQQHKSFFFPLFYNIRIHIVVDSFHFVFNIIAAMDRS